MVQLSVAERRVLVVLGLALVAGSLLRLCHLPQYQDTALKQAPLIISINTADWQTLTLLPGIGPALAGRIVAYRAAHGNFKTSEDVIAVKGIGPKKLQQFKEYLIFEEAGKQ